MEETGHDSYYLQDDLGSSMLLAQGELRFRQIRPEHPPYSNVGEGVADYGEEHEVAGYKKTKACID